MRIGMNLNARAIPTEPWVPDRAAGTAETGNRSDPPTDIADVADIDRERAGRDRARATTARAPMEHLTAERHRAADISRRRAAGCTDTTRNSNAIAAVTTLTLTSDTACRAVVHQISYRALGMTTNCREPLSQKRTRTSYPSAPHCLLCVSDES